MIKFKRKRFFIPRLMAFALIVAACGVGFIWNGVITDFANRQIFGNQSPPSDTTFAGGLDIHFIDVGQGDAVVIRFPNEQIMIVDAGTNTTASRNAFSEYLQTHIFPGNTPRIVHYFVATHSHADHIGAAYYLLANYQVNTVIRPLAFTQHEINTNVPTTRFGLTPPFMVHNTQIMQNFVRRLDQSGATVRVPYRGKTMTFGGAQVEFLSPNGHYFDALNRLSTIFTITFQGRTIMFTGDSYVACELVMLEFLAYHNRTINVDILDVSHHGSTTSTSLALVNAINPTYAIIQVGTNNFGHPHGAIIRRLEAADATVLTTRQVGDIHARVSSTGVIEINGAIAPGQWFSYWILVAMTLATAFAILLAMDFITKNQRNSRRPKQRKR